MSSNSKKNGRIELLRFLFAIMILLFHIQKRFAKNQLLIGSTGLALFCRGYIGVEFFFLVSGYLLTASCYAKRELPCEFIGTETANMMWKKIKSVFPYHLFAMIITIAVNAFFLRHTAISRVKYVLNSWAAVFMLQVFGFETTWVNKLTWYLDVWLMVTFIFYIFLRKHYDVFAKIVCPTMALFILGYLDHEYGGLSGIEIWTGHFYKAFLRGFAEMALGCSAYSLTRFVNKEKITKSGKRFLGVVEIAGYVLIFVFSCVKKAYAYEFPILFIMWGLVILTFSDVNPVHEIFDKPIFSYLGKMSLLIYLNQFYVIRLVQELLPNVSLGLKVLLCVIFTFVGAFVCDVTVKKVHWKGIKKWFLVQ